MNWQDSDIKKLDRYAAILRYLFDSGPTPKGFGNIEENCYGYTNMIAGNREWTDDYLFEGWLQMIDASMLEYRSKKGS